MNIMLACALGMSTSLLVTKMLAAAKAQGKDYHIWAVDIESVEYEEGYDVVLLGPQVSNRIAEVRDSVDNDRIPVAVIDRTDYGKCNGAAVLAFAEQLCQKNEK